MRVQQQRLSPSMNVSRQPKLRGKPEGSWMLRLWWGPRSTAGDLDNTDGRTAASGQRPGARSQEPEACGQKRRGARAPFFKSAVDCPGLLISMRSWTSPAIKVKAAWICRMLSRAGPASAEGKLSVRAMSDRGPRSVRC